MTLFGSSLRGKKDWVRRSFVFLSIPWLLGAAAPGSMPDRGPLRAKLQAFVDARRFSGALWGVKVVSLDHGDVIFEAHADRLLSPASNAKIYVSALVLDRLGGDYRIVTPLLATAAPDAAGVVPGDLIVAGRGDPSWKTRDAKRDFWTLFDPFVAAVERAGIKAITGDVIADATYFRTAPAGESWAIDDLTEDYGAEISAITLEDNYADARVVPGAKVGDPCRVELVQPLTGMEIDNRTATSMRGVKSNLRVVRFPGDTVARVFGGIAVGGKEELVAVTIPRPASWFAVALKAALERRGIVVSGVARSARWPEAAPERGAAISVGDVRSPPLRELVKAYMKPSQNLETDLVFLHVGERQRQADTPGAMDTNTLALAALHEFLCEYALRADEVKFDEGSGLSLNNLTSAGATLAVLAFMQRHREAAAFLDSLPVAGVDGTLKRRFKGTAAEANLRAKTGSLRWTNSLAGFLTTATGEHVAFTLILNRYASLTGRTGAQEIDEGVALIAGYAAEK